MLDTWTMLRNWVHRGGPWTGSKEVVYALGPKGWSMFCIRPLDRVESDSSPQSSKLINSDFISFREVDPLLWTIVSNNMESPNDSLIRVLMCFLESSSMLPVSRYCLVYLCAVERFIRYLSHISLIGRVAAI